MDFEIIEPDCFPLHCRTCFNQFQGVKHKVSDLSTPLFKILEQSAEYEKEITHELYPDGICQACFEKLESFYEFQTICKKTKEFLDNILSVTSVISTIDFETNNEDDAKVVDIDLDSDAFSSIKPQENQTNLQTGEIVVRVEFEDSIQVQDNTNVEEDSIKVQDNNNVEEESQKSSSPSEPASVLVNEETVKNATKRNNCEVCQKSYSSPTALKRHMLNHADERPFPCDICGRGFNAKCQLQRHIEEHLTIQIACKFNCGKTFDRTYKAAKHYRKEHKDDILAKSHNSNDSLYICEECGKSFKTRRSLNDHRNSHLPEEKRPYKCEQCGKRLATTSDLRIHVMRHNGTQNFQCSYCGLKKTTARELRLHISNIHTKDRQVRCELCSKIFLNPGCLKRHENVVHFGYKKYKCRYCDEAFGAADTLKYHERRHTGTKPHKCNTCGHSFIQPYALKKHMNTHKELNQE